MEINKRAAESDLLVYVNINLVSMDGGCKSTATGLAGYRSLTPPPQRAHDAALAELHGPPQASELHTQQLAHGRGAHATPA